MDISGKQNQKDLITKWKRGVKERKSERKKSINKVKITSFPRENSNEIARDYSFLLCTYICDRFV